MEFKYDKSAVGVMATKIAISLFFLFSMFPAIIYCQDHGLKYIRNFSAKEYKLQPQNWSVLQDKRGLIYVGNNAGLLEFDGVSWRTIEVPNYSVRSLAVAETGIVYVGGNNELGFLAPDEKGTLIYKSLLEHIPTQKRGFSNIWETHCVKDGVYFRSNRFLFHWDPAAGSMKTLETPLQFNASFNCGGKYFVRIQGQGLMEIVDGALQLTPNGEVMKSIKIFFMAPYKTGTYLLGTHENGLFLYDYGGGTLTPFPTEADEYIKKKQLYDGIRLAYSPGSFALATTQGGQLIQNIVQAITKQGVVIDDQNFHDGCLVLLLCSN